MSSSSSSPATLVEELNLFSSSAQFAQERLTGAYKKDVILDTDMGWDDVLSLCLLIKNPNINLLGVCVSNLGEAHLKPGLINAKRILKQANLGHVPVVPGARTPLSYKGDPESRYLNVFPERNFRTKMDTLNFGKGPLLDKLEFPPLTEAEMASIGADDVDEAQTAWSLMKECLDRNENQVVIIALGGVTDIEYLFREKAKFSNIERIVIMGGAVDGVDGNVAALNNVDAEFDNGKVYETNFRAEWNIFIDPVAAELVFQNRHDVPLVLVPLNACNNVLLNEMTPKLLRHPDKITALGKGILEGEMKLEPKIPIFDPLCTLIASGNIQSYTSKHARIIVRTEQTEFQNVAGQTIAVPSSGGNSKKDFEDVKIVTTASSVEFINTFTYLMNMPSPKFVDVLKENPDKVVIPNDGAFIIPQEELELNKNETYLKVAQTKNPSPHQDDTQEELTSSHDDIERHQMVYSDSAILIRDIGNARMRNVAFVVFDKIELLDYTGLMQVFGSARHPYLEQDKSINFSKGKPAFNTFSVAYSSTDTVKLGMTSGDQTSFKESTLTFTPDYSFDDDCMPDIDVLVVIGGQGIDDLLENQTMRNAYVNFIKEKAKTAHYVLGGCSGALLLAHTELLNNLEVTTHHTRFEQLHELSQKNKWRLQVVDTRLGRNYVHNPVSKMMTSGGVHCVIAMGLHVVELYMGKTQKDYIADTVMEYTIPIGDFSYPSTLSKLRSYSYDPRLYVKGFSHLNVIVKDLKMIEEATDFYRKTLGFQEAWSLWLPEEANEHFVVDAGLYTREEIDVMKKQGQTQPVELLVRFLVHPNISIHLELMMYKGLDLNRVDPKDKPTFLNTYDVGGFRHVALEVDNCVLIWEHLKTIEEIDLLQKTSVPEVLHPDPQTFFYFRDPYGCQWEFEQGRIVSSVIKGVVS